MICHCQPSRLTTFLSLFVLLNVVFAASVSADERLEFFEKRIRPVLAEHCYQCHAADARNVRGGLLLDSKEASLTGGDSGPAVVPGDPEESLLLSAMKHESFEMPPEKKLSDDIIADFEKWIRDGAMDPREGGTTLVKKSIDLVEGRTFWSFRPISKPEVPQVESDWPVTSVDRFVAARQQEQGVSPAPDAAADVVLRRLYLVLTGLPPVPDDIHRFRIAWKQDADQAVANVADELLASPRYGERWGRHWLDVTRFAESSGGGRSLMFPHAWRFRDYAIESFNNDKRFDVLVREQVAGDLLPYDSDEQFNDQVCATAYLALGPTNYELQDKELLRMEVVDEQIDTVGRTFLGMTLGCARCHDHKFDPIPTSEYYALAGIFRSTQSLVPGNVSGHVTTTLRSAEHAQQVDQWNDRKRTLTDEIKRLQQVTGTMHVPKKGGIDPETLPGIVVDDDAATFVGAWTKSTSLVPYIGAGYRHDGNERTGKSVRFEATLPASGLYDVRLSHNYQKGRCRGVAVQVQHADGTTHVSVDQRQRPKDNVFASLGQFRFDTQSPAVVVIDAEKSKPGHIIADAVQFLPVTDEPSGIADAERAAMQERLKAAQQELKDHSKSKPEPLVTMSVTDQQEPADGHIHIRGGIRNLGPTVARGFLSVASHDVDEGGVAVPVEIADGSSGRRELADWIASPKNPLTTRVYVNRVWLHVMGTGLVRTPDNFGVMGTLPTHPKLLDYLASTFVTEDAWSTKRLIRRLVTSRVFRLSSVPPTEADPENHLLTHAFRRQQDAEAMRDSILQISGELDLSVTGGLTISKLTQYDGNYRHNPATEKYRSVYVPYLRNAILDVLDVFDTANPNVVTGHRNQTVLPGQALYLMNSPFVREQSKVAATRFLATHAEGSHDRIQMIENAWLLVLGREPTSQESDTMSQLLESAESPEQAWTAVFQALFGSIDFRFVD